MTPYRHNEAPSPGPLAEPSLFTRCLMWCAARGFGRFARRHFAGHWERHWIPPGPHADRSDYGEWGPWLQVEKCAEPLPSDTAGCPDYDQCEDWTCAACRTAGKVQRRPHDNPEHPQR